MKRRLFLSFSLFCIILIPMTFSRVQANQQPTSILSAWLKNPVMIDGKFTSTDEWEEATPVDVKIGEYDPGVDFTMRIWAKNDKKDLYLLYRVVYAISLYDDADDAGISYFWPEYNLVTGWEYNDASFCSVNPAYEGWTRDYYGWDETRFYKDVEAVPPGENNVEGRGTYDGNYYWFEMKKPLDSGDGYDWTLEPGETYGWHEGTPGKSDSLIVYFFDESKEFVFTGDILLTIAQQEKTRPLSQVSIGDLPLSMEMITGVLTIGAAGVGIAGWMTRTRRAHKRKKILFERFMAEIDNAYSDFKMNARRVEADLHSLNNEVLDEFKQGTLDEGHYNVLNERIDDYMNEVKEQIEKEKP